MWVSNCWFSLYLYPCWINNADDTPSTHNENVHMEKLYKDGGVMEPMTMEEWKLLSGAYEHMIKAHLARQASFKHAPNTPPPPKKIK